MIGNCGECNHRWVCDIDPNECDLWPDPVPMTNADHIRAMSDEELADFLVYFNERICEHCACEGRCTSKCIRGVREWLKQPYKEDA